MDIDSRLNDLSNKLETMKDEVKKIEMDYLKKDDINYNKYLTKVDTLEKNITTIQTSLINIEKQTEKNSAIIEENIKVMQSINITNTKLNTLLDGYGKTMDNLGQDIKDLKSKVDGINIDNSKNTDWRRNVIQIIIGVAVTAFIGFGSMLIGCAVQQKADLKELPQNNKKVSFNNNYSQNYIEVPNNYKKV